MKSRSVKSSWELAYDNQMGMATSPNAGVPVGGTTLIDTPTKVKFSRTKLNYNGKSASDMESAEWDELKSNFLKWLDEEENEAEHSEDSAAIAFDYSSVRNMDADGKLHVETTNISKANVCVYYGREIPYAADLGLDPEKPYRLYRDPVELRKGAETFNNLPILDEHVAFNTTNFDPSLIIGSTGTDAVFNPPYLKNSLVFWVRDAIDEIQSHVRKQLSCSYRYKPDMTPGSIEGEAYDGVMRDIVGNHVALVQVGRAGPDVVVGDAAIPQLQETFVMSKIVLSRTAAVAKGALLMLLRPKLANDAKIDLNPLLADVTPANFKEKKTVLLSGIADLTKGKLAKDAKLDDLAPALDQLASMDAEAEAQDYQVVEKKPDNASKTDDSAEDCDDAATDASEEDDDEEAAAKKKKAAKDKKAKDEKDMKDKKDKDKANDNMVSRTAMDEAIAAATKAERDRQNKISEAREFVRPWVGSLNIACDSADEIYAHALKAVGVTEVDKVHPSAYPHLLKAQPTPGSKRKQGNGSFVPSMATDGAGQSFDEMYPGAKNIGRV